MKPTTNPMTLIKLSTLGLGLLAVMIGIQVRSNEAPKQTLQEAQPETPLQVQPAAKVPQEPVNDSQTASLPAPSNSAAPSAPESSVAPTRVLSVKPFETEIHETDAIESTEEIASVTHSEAQVSITTASDNVSTKALSPSSKDSQKSTFETLIRPNQSVGPVTPTTTRADLVAQFGEEVLEDIAVHVGEGFTEPGTRVNLGADQSFSVIWNSQTGQARQVRDFGNAWKTAEGVGMGTSLKQLEAIAGPFELFGFGWDYGGTIMLEDSATMEHDGLIIRVHPEAGQINFAETDSPQTQAYQAVLGDSQFSSQHESFDIVDAFVYEMIVNFQDS